MLKAYYHLTKPGIIYGNAIAAIAGFLLASSSLGFSLNHFFGMLVGLSLVIASACVFNNVYDEEIDGKMQRTKQREIVTGKISKKSAFIFGSTLLALGILVLLLHTNTSALLTALVGWIFYVLIYTPLKRKTIYSTHVGAISGAVPPVVGYLAVTNHVDTAAWLLFAVLAIWQMPHFYAIGIFRLHDYQEAGLPILPVRKGSFYTKLRILFYILAFGIVSLLFTSHGYTGNSYLIGMLLITFGWLYYAISGFQKNTLDAKWAKHLFRFSLIVLLVFCILVSFGTRLP